MRIPAFLTIAAVVGLLGFTESQDSQTCALRVRLTDSQTGRTLPGVVRFRDEDGRTFVPKELLSRGTGLSDQALISQWAVLPAPAVVSVPRTKLTLDAFSGLETERAQISLDLTNAPSREVTLPLVRFYNARSKGLRSGNTHLHLQKISRADCDRYLIEVPQGDDLDAVFVSYLERAIADREYTSNNYTDADLAAVQKKSGVVFGNGEEHRHNFTGFGQGYGHVMLLNIKKLIQPVSIGPGIMKMGTDGLPIQRGIDTARSDGATIVWCHNSWGLEAVPNWMTGRLDAQNIFDGGTHGSFKDSFYRYLNAGLRVPFSTGTDWFMYDFSRVYVDMQGDLTVQRWLDGLAAGRSYITNGPLLEFRVNGKPMGETVRLSAGGKVSVQARGLGRIDFQRVELVQDGRVVRQAKSRSVGGHFEAELNVSLRLDEPAWLAVRTPPPPVKDDPELSEPVPKNEYGRDLFAHTSPVYVESGGRGHFDKPTALALLDKMQTDRQTIAERSKFADDQERARVLDVYTDGIAALKERIKRAGRPVSE